MTKAALDPTITCSKSTETWANSLTKNQTKAPPHRISSPRSNSSCRTPTPTEKEPLKNKPTWKSSPGPRSTTTKRKTRINQPSER